MTVLLIPWEETVCMCIREREMLKCKAIKIAPGVLAFTSEENPAQGTRCRFEFSYDLMLALTPWKVIFPLKPQFSHL